MEEQSTINILNQTINNFNFWVVFNLFSYSLGVTFGILLAKEIVIYFRRKLLYKYERMANEIKELNTKMHDRLIDLKMGIDANYIEEKEYEDIKIRLYYNSSRLKKYDETILKDINDLFNKISFNKENKKIEIQEGTYNIMEQIRKKVDDIWISKKV